MEKRISIYWSCSNFSNHKHRFWLTAWFCGRVQFLFAILKEKKLKMERI